MAQYIVSIPGTEIEKLKTKLSLATFPTELDETGWDYGAPLADVKRLVKYWETQFDFSAFQSNLNKFSSFHRGIQVPGFEELDIHYVHQRSPQPDAIPLLFVHGWPGSYIEVQNLLEPLRNSHSGVAFHIVAPSLPNFGWSEGSKKKGFGLKQYAETCHQLMIQLGYKQYVTQGGDWGFYITRSIGLLHPEACLASHVNMLRVEGAPTFSEHPLLALQHAVTPYTEKDVKGLQRTKWFAEQGRGYKLVQATKPQTLGYALQDSPVACLAWIYEKLHDWTDNYPWTDDEILTWISIYWFSRAGPAASVRIYYEVGQSKEDENITAMRTHKWIPTVKLGMQRNPKELGVHPWTWNRQLGPVVFESDNDHGGHFAAHEHPEYIIKDLRAMFGKGGPCHGIMDSRPRL